MKKFSVSLLVCVLVLSGCFLFTGCNNSELDKYAELKETLFELQANSENMYDSIYIYGTCHRQSNGSEITSTSYGYEILLQDIILLGNCIWERSRNHADYNHYWSYFDIERIEDSNNNTIWSK